MRLILIDEARTPLIISGPAEDSSELYIEINKIVPELELQEEDEEGVEGDGDTLSIKSLNRHLTERGQIKVEELLIERGLIEEGDSLYSASSITLLSHVYAALRAHKLYQKMLITLLKKTK